MSLLIALRLPPEWVLEDLQDWKKVNISAFSLGFLAFFISSVLTDFEQGLYTLGISYLIFILINSTYSDFKFRLVDRKILYTLIIFSLLGSILQLFSHPLPEEYMILYIFLLLLAFSTVFIPIFGASDGRMLLLGSILVFPVGLFSAYSAALIIMGVLSTLYAVYHRILYRGGSITTVSVPAVPIFALSFLAALLSVG